MTLMKLRFALAAGALLSIIALAAGVLFLGHDLTQTQVVLITLLAGALIAEAKSASAWTFDGVAPKTDPTTDASAAPNVGPPGPASPATPPTQP